MPPATAAPSEQGRTTKQALVIALLSRDAGATLGELVEVTGWLSHTTRASLTGLRHKGFGIERTQRDDRISVYRIVSAPDQSEAA